MSSKTLPDKKLDSLIEECFFEEFSQLKLSFTDKEKIKSHIPKKWWQKTIELSICHALAAGLAFFLLYGILLGQFIWISPKDIQANKLNEFYVEEKIGSEIIRVSMNMEGGNHHGQD